jgi:hypothetical protein
MALIVQRVGDELFDDVQTVFGDRGQAHRCQCQEYRISWQDTHTDNVEGRCELLRDHVGEGHGLLAYLDDEPVGWCSLGPRNEYPYLREPTWRGRTEDRQDATVWASAGRASAEHWPRQPSTPLATPAPGRSRRTR